LYPIGSIRENRCRPVSRPGDEVEVTVIFTYSLPQSRGASNEEAKVTNRQPKVRSDVRQRRTTRWPTGREPYGYGASIVVVGVTPGQGARESREQGKVRQVIVMTSAERYARCEQPKLS
jgi:hypothetical protein